MKTVCNLKKICLYITLGTLSVLNGSFADAGIKVGLVLDKGGKDDKSFNSAAYAGALAAQKELGIELKYVEATDTNALENLLAKISI